MWIARLICLFFLIFCAGCVGITVTKVSSDPEVKGVPWNLPMTQFTVTITRHVTECGKQLLGTVETLASSKAVPDPDQRYVLTSNGWFATSDISGTLSSNGFSTALNAQSTDATSTVIANVIGLAAQIAVAAAAAVPGGETTPPAGAVEVCAKDVADAVSKLYPPGGRKLKDQVDDDTSELAKQTAKVSLLTAQAAADKKLKLKLVQALADQAAAQAKLTDDQNNLAKYLKITTDTQVVTWPLRYKEVRATAPFKIPNDVWQKWTSNSASSEDKTHFDVDLAIYTQDPNTGNWGNPQAADENLKSGLPVRMARPARLLMCAYNAKDKKEAKCPAAIVFASALDESQTAADVVVLQAGPVCSIPVSGGTFRSESASVALDANGLPSSIQTSEKAAVAAGLSGSLKDAATQIAALPPSIRAAELAKTQAETNQINANVALSAAQATADLQGQTNVATATTALVNAQNALATAQQNAGLLPMQQQSGSLQAQKAILDAQAALVNAQANARIIDQTGALSAQTTLINAQTALINAGAALAKAQATVP